MRILLEVFKKPQYLVLWFFTSFIVFTFSVLIANAQLLFTILSSSSVPIMQKIKFFVGMYNSITTNFTVVSASYTIAIAVLFGCNIALLVYYIKKRKVGPKSYTSTSISSISGVVSGIFGIGCAACGSVILTAVLSLFGAGSLVTLLPFGGEEFGFIAIGLLLYSIVSLIRKINEPAVCTIDEIASKKIK